MGELMNLKSWTKTIFMVYRHLPKIINSIDKVFSARALNGGIMSGSACAYNDVYNLTYNLINLSERKKALINLKILADYAIKGIDKNLAKIIILRYMDGYSIKDLANHFNISERTTYRRIDEALRQASFVLNQNGYNQDKIEDSLKKEKWLFDLCSENCKDDVVTLDDCYLNKIINNYKKLSLAN